MAVIDTKSKTRNLTSDAAESAKETDSGRVVDIFSEKGLPTGKKVKLDASEDAWAFSAPPAAGPQDIKLFLAKEAVTLKPRDKEKEMDDENSYYSISMEAKIVSDDKTINNLTVFPYVNTIIGRGKNISTGAGLIVKLGYKLPPEASDYEIAKLLCLAIKKEPIAKVELDWQGYSKILGKNVYNSMTAFPTDKEGSHMHIVEYKHKDGTVEEIRAQLKVVHWYGKGEQPTERVKATGGAGAGKVTEMPLLMNVDEVQQVAAEQAKGSDGDMELLLEE